METDDLVEIRVAERVPVQREEGLVESVRGKRDAARGPERLLLDAVLELEIAVGGAEVLLDLRRQVATRDDPAPHAVPAQMLEREREERPVDERQHVLADALRQRAQPRSLAADQDDGGQAHPSFATVLGGAGAARSPRTRSPCARNSSGSSMLRPSIEQAVAHPRAGARPSRARASSGHSVTSTAASAPSRASSADVGDVDAVEACPTVGDGVPGADFRAFGEQARREDEARRFAHVVGARLEREPEQRDLLAASEPRWRSSLPITRRFWSSLTSITAFRSWKR